MVKKITSNKCCICGEDIPIIYAQLILTKSDEEKGLRVTQACCSHEGSKELEDYYNLF